MRVPLGSILAFSLLLLAALVGKVDAQRGAQSIGAPNAGRLVSGARLEASEHLRLMGSNVFGTDALVGMIRRAAARVAERAPGPPLVVGALSRPRGGRFPPHRSHQSGRDADIGFYLTDEDGRPLEASRFVALDSFGCGRDRGQAYCLDADRTFLLLWALLEDEDATIAFILLAPPLREQLLAAGRRRDEVPEAIHRELERVTEPRAASETHTSHLHVRIDCPEADRPRCRDGNARR